MLDMKLVRQDPEGIERKLRTKEPEVELGAVLDLDAKVRAVKSEMQEMQSTLNAASKRIGELKRAGGDATEAMAEVAGLGEKIATLKHEVADLESALTHELGCIPNIPMDDIKVSQDVADNVIMKEWGSKPSFDFEAKNHLELNEALGLFDFQRAAKTTGAGWPLYRGAGARLEWALINYMMNVHIKNGFELIMPPLLVRPDAMFGSGQLPKFADQVFELKDEHFDLYLLPTAEVVLNGLHLDEILDEDSLPRRYTAYTPCFRREAGAAGATERGLIRTHQFNKVEMFAFTKPEDSAEMFQEMLSAAEEILEGLELHYRNTLLVTGDMSFASAKTVDVEVWLPGQDRYYEVSSISNCTDYQARRSHTRYKSSADGKPQLVHTLNGSGLATSRLMVSLLECNQNPDGSVNVPKVLQEGVGTDILTKN